MQHIINVNKRCIKNVFLKSCIIRVPTYNLARKKIFQTRFFA